MRFRVFIAMVLAALAMRAQTPSFVSQVSKNRVQVGETFQVAFTLNANGSNLKFPDFKDFDILGGPNQSTSISMVNGSFSQSITYSLFLAAKKEGKFTIGSASVMSGGQKLETKPIVIEATKGAAPQQAQGNGNSAGTQQNSTATQDKNQYATPIDNDDLFVRTFLSKTKSYIGEQITLTQKVYSRVDLRGFQNVKFPALNGFWSQTEEGHQQIELHVENLDGINYYVAELNKTYLFPQRSGNLTIEPVEVECIVRRQTKHAPRNIFEQFFGASGYEDVVMKVKSKSVKVDVMDLPEEGKPERFNGAVGNFSFKTEISKQQVKANEAVNLKINLNGRGNIKLTEPIELDLPESFEVYDPKITEKINTNGGVSGVKVFDYLIIPRESGEFTLDHLDFSYFDVEKKQYVTVPSPEIKLTVLPGDENSAAQVVTPGKRHINETENDIRYLKTGDLELQERDSEFFASALHYLLLVVPCLLFGAGVYFRRQHIRLNSNTVAMKQRKAARMAKKQLVIAEKHMKANQKELFFDEVSAALNRYISHKLDLPVADLSRDNIRQNLLDRHVNDATLNRLMQTLDTCEYARYAPGAVTGDLQGVYQDTIGLITTMEDEIKA